MLFQPISVQLKSLRPSIDFLFTHSLLLYFGGFSKYVCKHLEIKLEPEPLVKSCWIVISWLYWSPTLPPPLGWLFFWVSTPFYVSPSQYETKNLSTILLEQPHWFRCVQFFVFWGVSFTSVFLSTSESCPTRLYCFCLLFCIHLPL